MEILYRRYSTFMNQHQFCLHHTITLSGFGCKGDERGKRIGSLLQELRGEQKHPQWLFNIDVEKIEKQRNKKTHDIIKVNEEFGRQMDAKKRVFTSRRSKILLLIRSTKKTQKLMLPVSLTTKKAPNITRNHLSASVNGQKKMRNFQPA